MANLYTKDNGDGGRERIEKARNEVEELARDRLARGVDKSMAEARVAVYKARPDLTEVLWNAPIPEPEPEPEPVTKRRSVEAEVLEKAEIERDKTPGLSLAEAAIRVLRNDRDLARRYLDN